MDRTPALLLALLVVLGGCAALPADPARDQPGSGPTTAGTPADGVRASVVAVVDGDTLDVRFANGTRDTVRLLGVDVPETHVENDPAEFEGVPETAAGRACLERAGENATRFVTEQVLGERVTLRGDPLADHRGRYGRLLAMVVHDGRTLNYALVARGHARVYDSQFSAAERFYAAEARARANATGLWACATRTG